VFALARARARALLDFFFSGPPESKLKSRERVCFITLRFIAIYFFLRGLRASRALFILSATASVRPRARTSLLIEYAVLYTVFVRPLVGTDENGVLWHSSAPPVGHRVRAVLWPSGARCSLIENSVL